MLERSVFPKASIIQIGTNCFQLVMPKKNSSHCGLIDSNLNENLSPKFLDLFWFYNLNSNKKNISDLINLNLVTFSLNLNYGNLRINGYANISEAFNNQALFITKDLLTINASIYPTGIYYIKNCLKNGNSYSPIEQLFVKYDPENEPWQNELTHTIFKKHNDRIQMIMRRGDKNYYYIFEEQQLDLFYHSLDFILNTGPIIVGSKK